MEGAVRSGRAAADTALAGGAPPPVRHYHRPDPAPALAVARSLQSTDTEEVA